jgi:hypothetical protein
MADGWLTMDDLANLSERPSVALRSAEVAGFRRAATRAWTTAGDQTYVEIRLSQYQRGGAYTQFLSARDLARDDGHTQSQTAHIPGSASGLVRVWTDANPDKEAWPYEAFAVAWHGDVLMSVWVLGEKPIDTDTVVDLARRQVERL